MDKERLIKRTQLKRSVYEICGKTNVENDDNQKSLEEMKDRHLKDYDEEIYDDQDFYNQLMRELIDRQTNNVLDPVELSRKSIELQNLRNKNKKKVDTKASKGRKIKFDVHKPMVNFMAPIFKCKMADMKTYLQTWIITMLILIFCLTAFLRNKNFLESLLNSLHY